MGEVDQPQDPIDEGQADGSKRQIGAGDDTVDAALNSILKQESGLDEIVVWIRPGGSNVTNDLGAVVESDTKTVML